MVDLAHERISTGTTPLTSAQTPLTSAHAPITSAHAPDSSEPLVRTNLTEIDARLRAVEHLIKIFRLERYIYLAISIASFVVIVVFATYIFMTTGDQGRSSLLAVLFAAPSGALLYVSAAFLKMWTQALQVLGGKGAS